MKVVKSVVLSLCAISVVLAEPPVGDGYPSAHSSDHDDYHEHLEQRSLSSSYNSRNSLPHSRAGYSPPTARVSFTQRFSSPQAAGRSDALSQEYGAPARSLATEYGAPAARSLSQEYGAPVVAARSNQNYNNQGRSSQSHSARQFQDSYNSRKNFAGKSFSRNAPSSTYGAPSSRLSSSYGVPSARDSDSYSQEYNSISQAYGAPSQRDLSDTYAAPSARGLAQEYGAPASRSNLKTDAIASSYASASSRSSPSSSYLPAARMPSQQYGVPEDNQGYDAARARALEELLNQAPANYEFSYEISDAASGGDFGHAESRREGRADGAYFVLLPDGTKQTVEYSADEAGFKPRVSVEPAGYDANAQDAGPY